MAKQITTDEWLADLEAKLNPPDDLGLTAMEIADKTGREVRVVQKMLRAELRSGKTVQGWATRRDAMGRRYRTPVYREAKP